MRTRPSLLAAVLLYLAADSSGSAAAQTVPRLYPDPGYRCLGVYGGGPSSHFDYRLIKLHLDDSFRDKKQWWQNLKAGRATDGASPHDVFLLYPGIKRGADLETARRRIDAWLKSEPEAETYPQLIPAVCIEEENVRKHDGILDALARHIRQSYGVAVFQWYSMPIEPNPALTADGWILDAYGMPPNQFRKHLMKFVALRRPVLCVPWASDPQWPGWKKFASAEAMIDAEWHQFDACLEFNVSPAVFAVAGAGSVNAWLASNTPQMVVLRDFLAARRAAMHAFRPGELPLASAGFSARDEVVSVGGDPDEPSAYVEQFDGFRWIHDASLAGFQHMRLGTYRRTTTVSPSGPQAVSGREVPGPAAGTYPRTTAVSPSGPQSVSGREVPGPAVNGRTDEFGGLELTTIPGEVVAGSLVYRLESFFPLESVRVLLQSSAPTGAQCHNQIALARDEAVNEEPLGAVQTSAERAAPLELNADSAFLRDARVVYLRVAMTNSANRPGLPGNRLDRLEVRCAHRPPPAGAAAALDADAYGNLFYQDGFTTSRWRHLGQWTADHADRAGWRPGAFWIGLVGGGRSQAHLMQRLTAPRDLTELRVSVDCRANAKQLGGHVSLAVTRRGGTPQWKTSTEGRSDGTFRGPLNVELAKEELQGLREFDVHVLLESRSGVEQPTRWAASISRLAVQGR